MATSRKHTAPAEAPSPSTLPAELKGHLADQQDRARELQALLEMADRDDDRNDEGVLTIAARLARDLNNALDSVTLGRLLSSGSGEASELPPPVELPTVRSPAHTAATETAGSTPMDAVSEAIVTLKDPGERKELTALWETFLADWMDGAEAQAADAAGGASAPMAEPPASPAAERGLASFMDIRMELLGEECALRLIYMAADSLEDSLVIGVEATEDDVESISAIRNQLERLRRRLQKLGLAVERLEEPQSRVAGGAQ